MILTIIAISGACFQASALYEDRSDNRDHDERFDNSVIVDGIDVSTYQDDNIDWDSAKESGIDFAIMRVTLTRNKTGKLETDNTFEHNYNEASDAGIMCGVYAFSQAANARDGKKEARYAVSRLKELGIEPEDLMLPVYMDYEFLNKSGSRLRNLTQKDAIAAAQAFCETVQSYGYDAGIYANSSFFSEYLNQGRDFDDDIDLWIAQYSSAIGSDCQYTKWQYSSSASIADINSDFRFSAGKVDINYWYIDREPGESTVNISGSTNVEYTGKPVIPKLGIFDVNKRMKEGVDYIVGGIRNIEKGSEAYAYIKGIGDYEGYALVPISINDETLDKINLPSKVIQDTNYESTGYMIYSDTGRTCIGVIPEGTSAGDLLSAIQLSNENYYTGIINCEGDIIGEDEAVSFSDMLGVYNSEDDTLIGTIDIETETEKGINHIRRK